MTSWGERWRHYVKGRRDDAGRLRLTSLCDRIVLERVRSRPARFYAEGIIGPGDRKFCPVCVKIARETGWEWRGLGALMEHTRR